MSEEKPIPAEMLDAAEAAIDTAQAKEFLGLTGEQRLMLAEAALRAAGVAELVARIAELEAALRNRICEGCDKLMANVGMLHLCGCRDQRNLCSACKAGCACAGGV